MVLLMLRLVRRDNVAFATAVEAAAVVVEGTAEDVTAAAEVTALDVFWEVPAAEVLAAAAEVVLAEGISWSTPAFTAYTVMFTLESSSLYTFQ